MSPRRSTRASACPPKHLQDIVPCLVGIPGALLQECIGDLVVNVLPTVPRFFPPCIGARFGSRADDDDDDFYLFLQKQQPSTWQCRYCSRVGGGW